MINAHVGIRDLLVIVALSAAFFAAFHWEPTGTLPETRRICPGQPEQVLESLDACRATPGPGCECWPVDSPVGINYWLLVILALGVGSGLLVRAHLLPAAVMVALALAVGGAFAMIAADHRDALGAQDRETWHMTLIVIVVIVLAIFAATRGLIHGIHQRRRRSKV